MNRVSAENARGPAPLSHAASAALAGQTLADLRRLVSATCGFIVDHAGRLAAYDSDPDSPVPDIRVGQVAELVLWLRRCPTRCGHPATVEVYFRREARNGFVAISLTYDPTLCPPQRAKVVLVF